MTKALTAMLGPGCARKKFVQFCHTSAKNVIKLAVSSATHVSGQTAKKSSRKPPPCDWLALRVR